MEESKTTGETRQEKQDIVQAEQALKTLRDEIRVKLHLAGMQAKESWQQLDKEVEHVLATLDSTARVVLDRAVSELIVRLQKFSASLRSAEHPKSPPRA